MTTSEPINTASQPEELRTLRGTGLVPYLLPILFTVSFGLISWSNGRAYASVFFGAISVMFMLHSIGQRRSRREIDLVLALLAEERKGK